MLEYPLSEDLSACARTYWQSHKPTSDRSKAMTSSGPTYLTEPTMKQPTVNSSPSPLAEQPTKTGVTDVSPPACSVMPSAPPPTSRPSRLIALLASFWQWLWCTGARERAPVNAAEKLKKSMRVTAKSRYNAAVRLQRQGKFAFFTIIVLSLGLILIPLAQNSGVLLSLPGSVLNMFQIFLAVAVLVYSVVIGTARYDLRAEVLTQCGDKVKDLLREMDKDQDSREGVSSDALASYQMRYSGIVTVSENHSRGDYHLARLEMRRDHLLTGLHRFGIFIAAHLSRLSGFLLPVLMLLAELLFLLEMLGVTRILGPYLVPTAP